MTMNKNYKADHNYKWTDTDLCEFAEWIAKEGWEHQSKNKWYHYIKDEIKYTYQLRNMWLKEKEET